MKKFWKKLFSNWLLKLASLVIAFGLWFVVISIDGDPVGSKTLTNIPVTLTNTELITDMGMVYEVLDGTDVLRSVTFEAPKSVRDAIEAGDIVAVADLNDLTVTNTVAINLSCPKYNGKVTNISGNISNVKLNIENEKTSWINIDTNVIGEVAEGYLISQIRLDQNRLRISGPESKVSEVAKAVVDVNVDGISSNIATKVDIRLQDADGNVINYDNLTQNFDTVSVTVTVYATKEVPVEYLTTGVPASGYAATGVVNSTPDTVVIAGDRLTLAGISKITVPEEEIDITGAQGNYESTIDLTKYLPAGVVFADSSFSGKASVVVYIEEIVERRLNLDLSNIQILNVPEGFEAQFPEGAANLVVQIRGMEQDVSAIHESGLNGTVDVTEWMNAQGSEEILPGLYEMKVEWNLTEDVELVNDVTVFVELLALEEEE